MHIISFPVKTINVACMFIPCIMCLVYQWIIIANNQNATIDMDMKKCMLSPYAVCI